MVYINARLGAVAGGGRGRKGKGVQIHQSWIEHVRAQLKKDQRKELEYLQKDRYEYINSLFFERVEEVKTYQRKLWEIINNPSTKQEAKIKAIDSLNGTTTMLVNIYDKLPLICHNSVRADKLKVFNIEDSDNNITTTTITTTGNEEVHPDSFTGEEDYRSINWSERNRFGKWCSKYNPKHPHCPCEVVD